MLLSEVIIVLVGASIFKLAKGTLFFRFVERPDMSPGTLALSET